MFYQTCREAKARDVSLFIKLSRYIRIRALYPRVTCITQGNLRLYGQANKRTRWMPWRSEAMKDVAACEKYRGAGNKL